MWSLDNNESVFAMRLSVTRWIALILLMAVPLAWADAVTQAADNRYVGGQPSADDLQRLAESGVRYVINLRPAAEQTGYDESAAVQAEGMEYHNLPVAGAADISFANAQALDALLAEIGDEPVLLHCASGNRVGALMALRAAMQGQDDEAAIAEGRRWGMTRLEPLVRQRLQEQDCLMAMTSPC